MTSFEGENRRKRREGDEEGREEQWE